MRWDITKESWNLARRQFSGAKSLYVSLPVRFKMSGQIPVCDLAIKSEIGTISYKVTTSQSGTTLVLQCKEEQVAYPLPPARMMTFATAMGKAEIKGSGICAKEIILANPEDKEIKIAALAAVELEEFSPENVRKWLSDNDFPDDISSGVCDSAANFFGQESSSSFNYRSAKSKTERDVKNFPSTVHVIQDGNAMVVADVFQVRRVRHKNKQYEWWQVRPAGSSKAFWVLSDFIQPIKAGTIMATTAQASRDSLPVQPSSSFVVDDIIWLQDKKGQLFGPLYVVAKRGDEIGIMPAQHGFVLFPGMPNNFGKFLEEQGSEAQVVKLSDYDVMVGEWRATVFRRIEVGTDFKILGYDVVWSKRDENTAIDGHGGSKEFDGLDLVYARDPNFGMSKFDPWSQVTGPENEESLKEAIKILKPGTAVVLKNRGPKDVETMGTFERWEETKNPMNPSKKGPKAMVVKVDDTGNVIRVLPGSRQREWDVKVLGATTIDSAFRSGHFWAVCDDPIMDDPSVRGNLVKQTRTPEETEKIVAILSIEGDVVLARVGDALVKVPKSSLRPAIKSDKGLPWVIEMQRLKHPYRPDDVLLRDGKKYVVVGFDSNVISVRDESGKEMLLPNDGNNKYIGISIGSGIVAKPMSMRSKALRPNKAIKEEELPSSPLPPAPPLLTPEI